MARSTRASTRCARRSTDQATFELLGPPCASCRSPAIPGVRASILRIPIGGNLASQGASGRAELLEEPRTLRGDRLVPPPLWDRASLEFGARLPCQIGRASCRGRGEISVGAVSL